MAYLFYGYQTEEQPRERSTIDLATVFLFELWRPSLGHVKPLGLHMLPYFIWACFVLFGVFQSKGYSIYVVRDAVTRKVLHRSHVFPKWFRFPFMAKNDLQIGDTFTEPEIRGQGLAEKTLNEIVCTCAKPDRVLWYVVEESNKASIRVAEKCGFKLMGRGTRVKRFGLRLFGKYVITERL